MIPLSDLKLHNLKDVCKKVGEWLGKDMNFQTSYLKLNDNEPDWNKLEQEAHRFYEIVLKELGGNEFIFSRSYRTNKNNEEVVKALNKAGFNVNTSDFNDIIEVARTIRDFTIETEPYGGFDINHQLRPVSLNCYDYETLKKETKKLAQTIGYRKLELHCPIFSRILAEAAEGENSDYPARHLPLNRITGRSAKLYQCLRIMDEILCASDHPLDNTKMLERIRKKAFEYNIPGKNGPNSRPFEKNITNNNFKHYYAILKDLINVEYSAGKRLKYDRSVYESGHFSKHLYKNIEVEDNEGRKKIQRLSAFTVEISLSEASHLRKEIGLIRVKFFNDDFVLFAEKFPLISKLGYIEDLVVDENKTKILNDLDNTDLKTVNYKSDKFSILKATIKGAIASRLPIAVTKQGSTDIVIPQAIKENGDKWVLVALDMDNDTLRVISPEILSKICECIPQQSESELEFTFPFIKGRDGVLRPKPNYINEYIMGTGQLKDDYLYYVQIETTKAGINDIYSKESPFSQLKLETPQEHKMHDGEIVSFYIYINDDFLEELLRLDRTAKLIDIKPTEVKEIYESYFEDHMGVEQTPFSRKRLKRPKAKKEQEQSDTNPLQGTTPPTLE